MKLPNWPALLGAPSLALTSLSITYALVSPSCALQSTLPMHAVSALSLLACAVFTWAAWRNWTRRPLPYHVPQGPDDDARGHERGDAAERRRPFIALVAWLVGALSCLTVLAQWFPQWILSPCAIV